jgi:heterodisulfide reductase subunit A-like polyferredoxin
LEEKPKAVLVVGGGIAGIQAALDLGDGGIEVHLVEKTPSIGGRMAQLDKTFPTNDCSMCILAPKMTDCYRHPNINLLTCSEIKEVSGSAGNFTVKILKKPRYVDEEKCTGCDDCSKVCPVKIPNEFDMGLGMRNAIYRPFPQAVPNTFIIDKRGIPPCRVACPAGVNVQGYIALITQGKFKEALELVRKDNPFPTVCGMVCFRPCEAECERGKVDEPVAIDALKRFVADCWLKEGAEKPKLMPKIHEETVAIIGSGPAGLAAAYELIRRGYSVTVFESLPKLGGMLRVGIPEYRLPKGVLDAEIQYIKELGVEIRTNVRIGRDLSIDDLLRDGYKAVFIAIGAQKSRTLGIEGEELKGVIHALDFLREVNLGKKVEVGDKVAVIGGGNVAVDAARTALRLGSKEVCILYRRSRGEMPANREEVEQEEREGVKIHFLVAPRNILGKDGQITAVECIRMRLGAPDETGRRRPVPIKGSEFIMKFDTLIMAIGETPDLFPLPEGVEVTRWNTIAVDTVTLQTSLPHIFAGGDVVSGPATVIEAIAAGKRAAVSIDRYLRGEDLKIGREEEIRRVKEVPKEDIVKKARQTMPLLPLDQRVGNFKQIELGFTEEMAMEEAKRCLMCGGCSECLECEKACEPKAIIHEQKEELIELKVAAIILATGFAPFNPSEITEYGYRRYKNVITALELERLLSASGPTGGKLVRPSDKAIPHKLAFIQCVGSRSLKTGYPYCSSVCCMYATKEAVIAKEHMNQIEPTIFYIDLRAYGKNFDKYIERAKNEYGVRFIRCRVSKVEEIPKTQNLKIRYETEDGRLFEEEFDLVVLSIGFTPSENVKKLAKNLGVELNEHGFCKTRTFHSMETSRSGVFVCGMFSSPKDIPETVTQASAAAASVGELLPSIRGTLVKRKEYPEELDVRGQPPRIGVFICHCGINIGGVVDVPSVVEYAQALPNVVYACDNLYSCSSDAQEIIKQRIQEYNLNRVVVASCSPRTHEPLFQETIREAGLNRYLFEMANIRDQCSWVHMHDPEAATEKAKDLVRMVVAKARMLEPLERLSLNVTRRGLVIGGGLSGMTAALSLADQGFEVYLVEKNKELGGFLRKIHYTLDNDDAQRYLKAMIERVNSNKLIQVFLNAKVENVSGYVGNFRTTVTLNSGNEAEKELEHGVIIVATGGEEHHPNEYLYTKDPRVLTQLELEKRIAVDGEAKFGNVVMIQCVGSRCDERPYCSRMCCGEAVKNALKIKEKDSDASVYVLYRDIRTYGLKEEHYRKAREAGVVFIRYDEENKPKVAKAMSEGKEALQVSVFEPTIREDIAIDADMVVLSVAVVPPKENEILAKMLKVPINEDGFFLEAHAKLRPVDFATDGIYVCGMAHSPKSMEESISQAKAAVSRACTVLTKDTIEAEGIIATVNPNRCTACELCIQVCAYNAIEIEETRMGKIAKVHSALCKGCGACAATCRGSAIDIKGFTDHQISLVIAALR